MKKSVLFRNQQNYIERFDDGDAVILDEEKQYTHLLNITALQIYDLCDGRTCEEVIKEFLDSYRDNDILAYENFNNIRVDVSELIRDFLQKGIIYEEANNS